jgi:hypothetical protein
LLLEHAVGWGEAASREGRSAGKPPEPTHEVFLAVMRAEQSTGVTIARGDLRRGIEVVEFACGIPTLLMGESLENIARGIDRHLLGVVAGICPFNFPPSSRCGCGPSPLYVETPSSSSRAKKSRSPCSGSSPCWKKQACHPA